MGIFSRLAPVINHANEWAKHFNQSTVGKTLNTASKVVKAVGLDLPIGAAKSVMDIPRQGAQIAANVGVAASKATDKARGITRPESENVFQMGAKPTAVTRPTNTAQKIGFGAGQLAQLATPLGEEEGAALGASVASKLGLGEKAAQWASSLGKLSLNSLVQGGVSTLQTGNLKEGLTTAATNFVANPALHAAGSVAGAIAKTLSGGLSSTPSAAFERMFKKPAEVQKAINFAASQGEGAEQAVMTKAKSAFDELKNIRQEAYQKNLEEAAKTTVPEGFSLNNVKKTFMGSLHKFGINVANDTIDASASKLPKAFEPKLQEVAQELGNWKDLSPLGLDTLTSRLQNLATEGASKGEKQFNSILGSVTEDLNKFFADQMPAVGKLRSDYAAQTKALEDLTSEAFSGKESANLNRLLEIFNPKKKYYRNLIKDLGEKTGSDLLSDVAGVVLSKATPEGLGKYIMSLGGATGFAGLGAALSHPAALAAIPATMVAGSPWASGQVARAAGTVAPAVPGAIKAASALVGKALNPKQPSSVAPPAPQGAGAQTPEAIYPQYKEQIDKARAQGVADADIMTYLKEKTQP